MEIEFLLNGEKIQLTVTDLTMTTLDWLREVKGLRGTKEGCNEGDCGACTVMVDDGNGVRAQNACILFLPQLHGKSLRTVEGLSDKEGLHPVQQAMIDEHGSQCGFCTPGFVMSMATAHANQARDYENQLAGNLCRCTGYAPIIRAAKVAEKEAKPSWIEDDVAKINSIIPVESVYMPRSLDEFATWYSENSDAILLAGGTDVGLWVTKQMRDLDKLCFLHQIGPLNEIKNYDDRWLVGAGVTINRLRDLVKHTYSDFAELLRRYGSMQIRNAATIGGNIANASPIGDSAPALIALGAELLLQRGYDQRVIQLEDYFIEYGIQDRQAGEFLRGVFIPKYANHLKCYKISKRFDQDISALCGCFNITVCNGIVETARIAFGGMSGIPLRAYGVEKKLIGQIWSTDTIRLAQAEFRNDYIPISDMRASADYRLRAAENLLMRYYLADQGQAVSILDCEE